MRSINIKNVKKTFQGETILENVNLTIPGGKVFALLGPSGSGKTTLLRLIAGFETAEKGSIFLGNQDITHVPINERKINTVFQHYALFPHLNVFDNVAYGLRIKKVNPDIIKKKVFKMLKIVHLEKQMYKSVHQLSGGQQQRVALARAIVNEPEVLLLDEPLAALDLKLRERMLIELIELQDEFHTTFVYVTHDQFEALTVADTMAIMNQDGEIEQVGTPKEIYEFPKTSFVAQFVGNTNLFKGTLKETDGKWFLHVDQGDVFAVAQAQGKPWAVDGAKICMSIRPEKIEISKKELSGFSNMVSGIVESIVYHGRSTQYIIRTKNNVKFSVFEQNEEHFEKEVIDYDDQVTICWQKENAVLLEK